MTRIDKDGQFSWPQKAKVRIPHYCKVIIDASGVAGICSKLTKLNERPQVIAECIRS